ncbi:NACHT domain-containing protein [Streptomyces albus]|uniref:NACHT domain-containing protein n=1 Tax=Streptomyces albus TaxID=1888 RepID=UPI0006E228DA|nr:NACHT domain-containing protein [Streptomyces albus]
MAGGDSSGRPRWENRITGGRFGTVVQAERVEAVHIHVHETPVPLPRRPVLLWSLTALLTCAAVVLAVRPSGLPGGLVRDERLPLLLALVGAVTTGAAAVGRALERRRLARPRTPLPAHRLDQATERLAGALERQYAREDQLALSPVTTPTPIPVRWRAADPLVTDHEPNLLGVPAGTAARAGSLETDGEFAGIPEFFAALPRGRLVVLGAPGAGKTVLVHRLARRLLEARGPASGAPVPVVLPLASWNPAEGRGLWQWAAERLSAEHPVPLPTPRTALDLIESGRVLPVLDGFDELPGPSQADALRQLRTSLTTHARYVLTSRTREYTRAVEAAALPMPGAVAVELCPLTVDDLRHYLPRTSRRTSRADPSRTKWSPVLARLADPADTRRETRVLRQVLSTPLMVALARVAYSETDADPAELLGAGRFTTRQAIERHLYDAFLTAAYADAGPALAARARRRAAFLAAHARRLGDTEIAWWRLEEALPSWLRRLSVLPAAVTTALTVRFAGLGAPWWDRWVPVPLWAGCGLAALVYAWHEWGGRPSRVPQQTRLPLSAGTRPAVSWTAVGKAAGWTLLAVGAVYLAYGIAGSHGRRLGAVLAAAFLAYTVLCGVLRRARRPADPQTAAEPARLLLRDRRTALALGVVPTRGSGEPALVWGIPVVLLALWHLLGGRDVVTAGTWLGTVAGAALSSWLHENATSAWGRFTLARLWLTATGRLPWRLMDFLREAHAKGILRQSGGVHRFRHIELRNRLAEDVPAPAPPHGRLRALGEPVGGALGLLGGVLLFSTVLGMLDADGVPAPHPGPATACAVLPREALDALMTDWRRTTRDGTCLAGEQAPFAPEVQVSVQVRAMPPGPGGLSGAQVAHQSFQRMLELEQGQRRAAARASGRPGTEMLFDDRPAPGDEAVRVVTRTGLATSTGTTLQQARFTIRKGNLLVAVRYGEEFASRRRVAAVAESLLRRTLGRDDARDLAGIPRTRPPHDSRLTRHRQPEQRLLGAVWGRRERSYLWEFPVAPWRLRAPKQLTCDWGDEDSPHVSVYNCGTRADTSSGAYTVGPAAGSTPRLRLHLAELSCQDNCSRTETRRFAADRPGPAAVRWRPHGKGGPLYAVRRTEKVYELRLWTELHSSRNAWQLYMSVRVAPRHAELAQKILNSAYTQLGGR